MGSFEDKAIREGDAKARYAFILDRECLNESSILEVTHSSHPHLKINEDFFHYSRCIVKCMNVYEFIQ